MKLLTFSQKRSLLATAIAGSLLSVASAEDLQNLHRLCAKAAIASAPAQVIAVRFDIAPVSSTQHELGRALIAKSDNQTYGDDVSYSKCHVRILTNGRMMTKHFEIIGDSQVRELIHSGQQQQHQKMVINRTGKRASASQSQTNTGDMLSSIEGQPLTNQDSYSGSIADTKAVKQIQSFYFAAPSVDKP